MMILPVVGLAMSLVGLMMIPDVVGLAMSLVGLPGSATDGER